MAFVRPTLPELIDRIGQDLSSRLNTVGAPLRRALTKVMSRVMAGAAHGLHGHLAYLADQLFPDKSEAEFLVRQGSLFIGQPLTATFATGTITVTGTDATVIPADSVLTRSDGALFSVDADATIASGVATVSVTAELAGKDGNCDAGVALTFQESIAGVDAQGTAVEISGGTDQEDPEDYRTRMLERMRTSPSGGAAADYPAWAKQVSGVTRAWVYPGELGAGTVVVRFMRDNDVSPIPDSGEVAAVQAYLNTVRPVTAAVTTMAPVANSTNFSIHISPDTTANRAAVAAELADLLANETEPGGTLLVAFIRTAIGTAVPDLDYTLISPVADVTSATGHIPQMGTIAWS
jgi:uncharacterized phage protein gp47/JayE